MPNRTAKFVSALFAGLLAGAPLVTASYGAPTEADTCLSGPKGTAPQGGHWYYRVDRATKRHCWYIGDEKEKIARAAPQNSAASADPALPQKTAAPPKTISDARAELPLPQTRIEPEATLAPRAAAPAANAAGLESNRGSNAQGSTTPPSAIAARWPEPLGVSPSASPEAGPPATYRLAAAAPPEASAAPAPTIAAVTLAAADSSSTKQTGSIQTLLLVIISALTLAGLMGSAIFRFGSMRWPAGRGSRRHIWDSVSPSRLAYPSFGASMPEAEVTRETRAADDPNRRITEMLARLSRMTTN